ncbi:hypothetical protein [Ascidiimonas sp. W6]|uniref:hypothetical protein n=1 Tax=Ascidiimonas meishanensis TaxID=3128903 RepID=UPI0030EF48A9
MKHRKLHKNNGGFKLPDSYFETFEDRLSHKLTSSIPEKDGLKLPEGYFDSLADNVFEKLDSSVHDSVPVRKLFPKKPIMYVGYAVAAGFALLLFLNIFNQSQDNVNWNTIASTELESYIEEGYLSFSAYEYATLYEDVDLSKIEMGEEFIESEELMDYLYENVSSYDNLIIEN